MIFSSWITMRNVKTICQISFLHCTGRYRTCRFLMDSNFENSGVRLHNYLMISDILETFGTTDSRHFFNANGTYYLHCRQLQPNQQALPGTARCTIISTTCRQNIGYVTSYLSRFVDNGNESHWSATLIPSANWKKNKYSIYIFQNKNNILFLKRNNLFIFWIVKYILTLLVFVLLHKHRLLA